MANSGVSALYASLPVVFPEGVDTLQDTTPPTVFVWLVPLPAAEAACVESSGWNELEDLWEATDPDLFDLYRRSVV
ncbi:MAG: hypothetical protein RL701_1347 [Pseudomonadota bacterium]